MKTIDASHIPADILVDTLRGCADKIIREDGDRDHMNGSNLNCEQTMAMARIMLATADMIKNSIES